MRTAPVVIHVADFTGGPFAVSAGDGRMLHDQTAPPFRASAPAVLSFAGIQIPSGAFLAASIGPFCADFSEADLARLLTVRDISPDDWLSAHLCMKNARRYYANRAACDAAWREELEGSSATVSE